MDSGNNWRYRIVERLAEGGMAVVDRVVSAGPDGFRRQLVLKRIRPRYSSDPRFSRMFVDEARIVSLLFHPNIVQIYEFGKIDGNYFLVLEYVPGADLSRLCDRLATLGEPFPLPLAVFIAIEVCRALDYAHRKVGSGGQPLNIIHRDVSLSNILISSEGAVKLTDFGIAHATEREESSQGGVVKGKLSYMAPERFRGGDIDGRSDLFSLAVVLYFLLTYKHPYRAASHPAAMLEAFREVWPPPSHWSPGTPAALDSIVMKGLGRTPEERYATSADMAKALEEFLFRSRLRASASDLSALMKRTFGEQEPFTSPGLPASDKSTVVELSRVAGGDKTLPEYSSTNESLLARQATPDLDSFPPPPAGLDSAVRWPVPSEDRADRRGDGESRENRAATSGREPSPPSAWDGPSPSFAGDGPTAPADSHIWQTKEGTNREVRTRSSTPASSPPPPRRWSALAVAGVTLVLAVAVVLAISALPEPAASLLDSRGARHPHRAGPGATAEETFRDEADAAHSSAPLPARAEAAVGDDDAMTQPHDSGPSTSSRDASTVVVERRRAVERARRRRERPPSPRAQGWLQVVTRPHYAKVIVDGRPRGTTPLLIPVSLGRRRITLVNQQLGRSEERVIWVTANHRRHRPARIHVTGF